MLIQIGRAKPNVLQLRSNKFWFVQNLLPLIYIIGRRIWELFTRTPDVYSNSEGLRLANNCKAMIYEVKQLRLVYIIERVIENR